MRGDNTCKCMLFCIIIVSPVLETTCNNMLLLANWIHSHAIG